MPTTIKTNSKMFWKEEPSEREGRKRIRMHISGLHCSLCTGTIENSLRMLSGVDKVAVSLTHEQAVVEFDPTRMQGSIIIKTMRDMGYSVSDPRRVKALKEEENMLISEGNRFFIALSLSMFSIALISPYLGIWALLCAIVLISLTALSFISLKGRGLVTAAIGSFGVVFLSVLLYLASYLGYLNEEINSWLNGVLAIVLAFGICTPILSRAAQALKRGILNQHVLVEMGSLAGITGGIIGLFGYFSLYLTQGFFAVAVMVLTYHLFSEWLSLIVKTRSSQAVKKLLAMQPETAYVIKNEEEHEVDIEKVQLGDRVRILPGSRVPVDGIVIDGHSLVDESFVTGEPMPVKKIAGSKVIGGSLNGNGMLLVKVDAVGEESFLQQVIRHVENARAMKPGLLHLVDRVLRVYTPAVFILSVIAGLSWLVIPWFLFGSFLLQQAVFASISVLIMGYPCAVGISAPLAIVRGIGEAADRGILMRTGEAFQALPQVKTFVLDKTGTLTEGHPAIREILALGGDKKKLLSIASDAEASSEHPIAKAIVEEAKKVNITPHPVKNFENTPGKGIKTMRDNETVIIGNPEFLTEQGIDLSDLKADIDRLRSVYCQTVIVVSLGGQAIGLFGFGDTLRKDAAHTISMLHQNGIKTVLVTGDHASSAHRMAKLAGIDKVFSGILPGDKAELIRQIQQKQKIAMVGDGINDSPALMQANVGIAMGSGTDIAIDSADIIILNNRLTSLLEAREISRYSYRKMVQNITLALLFNGIGLPLAAAGLIFPVWAMAAMAASVTSIFFNSLRGRPKLFYDALSSVGSKQHTS